MACRGILGALRGEQNAAVERLMLRLLADEDFDNRIVRGLLDRNPTLPVVRVQDVGLSGQDDLVLLEWAARERRILLTHDAATMTKYAYERVRAGLPMPGV